MKDEIHICLLYNSSNDCTNIAESSAFASISILKRGPRGKHADWPTENILKEEDDQEPFPF